MQNIVETLNATSTLIFREVVTFFWIRSCIGHIPLQYSC